MVVLVRLQRGSAHAGRYAGCSQCWSWVVFRTCGGAGCRRGPDGHSQETSRFDQEFGQQEQSHKLLSRCGQFGSETTYCRDWIGNPEFFAFCSIFSAAERLPYGGFLFNHAPIPSNYLRYCYGNWPVLLGATARHIHFLFVHHSLENQKCCEGGERGQHDGEGSVGQPSFVDE